MSSFSCRKCGSCCEQPGFVYLKEGEAEKIAAWMKLDVYGFTDRYCDVAGKRHLVLKKHENERCVFLDRKRCLIYETRPDQCRHYPLGWKTERSREYCEGIRAVQD